MIPSLRLKSGHPGTRNDGETGLKLRRTKTETDAVKTPMRKPTLALLKVSNLDADKG